MADYSGTVSGVTINTGDRVTGDVTFQNVTIAAGAKLVVTGFYSVSFEQGLTNNCVAGNRGKISSSLAEPYSSAWNDLNINGMNAGASLDFVDLEHYDTCFFTASYSADNLSFDNVRIRNCTRGIQYASAADKIFTSLEMSEVQGIGIVINNASPSVVFDHSYFHDITSLGAFVWNVSGGDLSFTDCFGKNLQNGTGYANRGIFDLDGKTFNFTVQNCEFAYLRPQTYGVFYQGASVTTVNFTGNNFTKVKGDWFFRDCNGANFDVDDCDFQLHAAGNTSGKFATNGPNIDASSLRGGYNGSTLKDFDPSVVLDISSGDPIGTVLSYTNHLTELSRKLEVTSLSAVAIDNNTFRVTGTPGARGMSQIIYGENSVADKDSYDRTDYSESTNWKYDDYVSTADADRPGFLGARAHDSNFVEHDKTYYARMKVKMLDGTVYYSSQVSVTLAAPAGVDTTPPTAPTGLTVKMMGGQVPYLEWTGGTDADSNPVTHNVYARKGSAPDVFLGADDDATYFIGNTKNTKFFAVYGADGVSRLDLNGQWYFIVKTMDRAGNESASSNTVNIQVTNSLTMAQLTENVRNRFITLVEEVYSGLDNKVKYPNAKFTQPENSLWVQFDQQIGTVGQMDFGAAAKRDRMTGIATAKIKSPLEEGDNPALVLADFIKTQFKSVTELGVTYQPPRINTIGLTGKDWEVHVAIPFYGDNIS